MVSKKSISRNTKNYEGKELIRDLEVAKGILRNPPFQINPELSSELYNSLHAILIEIDDNPLKCWEVSNGIDINGTNVWGVVSYFNDLVYRSESKGRNFIGALKIAIDSLSNSIKSYDEGKDEIFLQDIIINVDPSDLFFALKNAGIIEVKKGEFLKHFRNNDCSPIVWRSTQTNFSALWWGCTLIYYDELTSKNIETKWNGIIRVIDDQKHYELLSEHFLNNKSKPFSRLIRESSELNPESGKTPERLMTNKTFISRVLLPLTKKV